MANATFRQSANQVDKPATSSSFSLDIHSETSVAALTFAATTTTNEDVVIAYWRVVR